MSPLLGFSDNRFQSRNDVLEAATSLIGALAPYKSPCGSRIKLDTTAGTGFDEISAQLEGFARPLWIVADLLALQRTTSTNDGETGLMDLGSWPRGLENGVNPLSETFWGYLGNYDQRMVEMEPIAYSLLVAPSIFLPEPLCTTVLDRQSNNQKRDMIISWMHAINDKKMPQSNWRWFRIIVNLALVKSCGVPYDEVKPFMDADFEVLDSFYLRDGWSSDGLWSSDKKQADYYSGSFAIQYSQLAYVRFAHDLDPDRVERYRCEARQFASSFWRYFAIDGAAIPFGRSLTGRFAFAAFWSAIAVTGISLPPPLNRLGVVKGLLLRHLRWWAKQHDMFNPDGTLSIGYTYPNVYMSEDYISPQSPYCCFKTFSVLGLPGNHPFWTCKELPHPLSIRDGISASHEKFHEDDPADSKRYLLNFSSTSVILPAVQMVCDSREHHFLLSAGQFTKKPHRAREAKYSKFAYSSAFAFSVPTGSLLSQMAPDSTLCISNDEGETWKVRWEPITARTQTVKLSLGIHGAIEPETVTLPALISAWRPWRDSCIQIETILIPPLDRWPGWHIRLHKLSWKTQPAHPSFHLVDAGFAILSQGVKGGVLPQLNPELRLSDVAENFQEGVVKEGNWEGDSACLIFSSAGASGVSQLSNTYQEGHSVSPKDDVQKCQGYLLKPDANTNLMAQRTLIPTLYHRFDLDKHVRSGGDDGGELWFVSGIFAVASSERLNSDSYIQMWQDKPLLRVEEYMNVF